MASELILDLENKFQVPSDVKAKINEEGLTCETYLLLTEDDLKELGFKMGIRKLALKMIEESRGSDLLRSTKTTVPSASLTAPSEVSTTVGLTQGCHILGDSLEQTLVKYVKPKLKVNGASLVTKLKSGIYFSPAERMFFVKVLGRRLMRTCAKPDFPSRDEKLALATEIVQTFPVLRDSTTPNGYELFFDPKAHSGYLESYIRNKRSRDPQITTQWTHQKRSVGVVLSSDDEERMLRELRPTVSNAEELLKLMENTRPARRNWISRKLPTITAILKRYPRLQVMNAALQSKYDAIIADEARNKKLRVEWRKLRDNVLDVARKQAGIQNDLNELLALVENDYEEEKTTEVSFRILPHLLPVPPQRGKKQPRLSGRAVEEMFFFPVQDDIAVETFVKSAPTNQPLLFRCQQRLWIKVDNSAIEITEASCFADAVQLLLAAFYVFNVEYPYHLKPMYEVIETVLTIRKTPQGSVARDLLRALRAEQP